MNGMKIINLEELTPEDKGILITEKGICIFGKFNSIYEIIGFINVFVRPAVITDSIINEIVNETKKEIENELPISPREVINAEAHTLKDTLQNEMIKNVIEKGNENINHEQRNEIGTDKQKQHIELVY